MFSRDYERFAETRRRVNVMPLGSGALAGSGFPFDREAIARELGFEAITRNSMDVSADRDFALDFLYAASVTMLHLSRLAEDWILYSSEEFGWLELGDGGDQRVEPDAAKEESRFAGADPRQKRPRVRRSHLAVRDHERSSDDLQSRHAGGQGAAVRRRGPVERVARNDAGGDRIHAPACRTRPRRPPKKAGWWRPTWPKLWRAPECRSIARINWWADWCWKACEQAKKPMDWTPEQLAAFAPEFTPDMARLLVPTEGMRTREIPGGTGPGAVAQALEEAEARLRQWRSNEQDFPPGPDPQADPRQKHPDARGSGARTEGEPAASRPPK